MAQTLFSNVDCWLKHMSLDEKTGLDQPGINLRAANGLEAVDYFVPGYAVWAKMVQALGDIGYDANNLVRKAPLAGHANTIIQDHLKSCEAAREGRPQRPHYWWNRL